MKILLLLLVALIIGEVSGNLQTGGLLPTTAKVQAPQPDGHVISAAVIAIGLIITIILIQQYARY